MGAVTNDTKTPDLPLEGLRDPARVYIEHTKGMWIRRNEADNTVELWFNGNFQCSWSGTDIPDILIPDMLEHAFGIGIREGKRQVREALGIRE